MSEYSFSCDEFKTADLAYSLTFNSFEQCNQTLFESDAIDITKYMALTKNIPYDHETLRRSPRLLVQSSWIHVVLEYLLDVSSYDARAFKITVSSLSMLGFDSSEYQSRTPKWVQSLLRTNDDSIKQEERFLKKKGFVKYLDYDELIVNVDGELVLTGYAICRSALYRLIADRYGVAFLEALLIRMGQLLFHFNDYKQKYQTRYIIALQRTIAGMSDDIQKLSKRNDIHIVEANNSEKECYTPASPTNFLSPMHSDVVMTNQGDYVDEITSIHRAIESTFNRVDGRISDIHLKLATITTKIDDIVGSIVLRDHDHNLLSKMAYERHSSIISYCSNPVLDHVRSIFDEYEQIGNQTKRSLSSPPTTHMPTYLDNALSEQQL